MKRIDTLAVHHSASPRETTTLEQIRAWHLERGFSDIGYHAVVLCDGRLRLGRPIPQTGAHARGSNATAIGVCLIGNNLVEGEHWIRPQIETLRRIVAAARVFWPEIRVCGHRDLMAPGYTECPGLDVLELLGEG